MAESYTRDVLVLKKTKLGETDLILTCLGEDGSLTQMVAKGARKPGNTFSSRLELYAFAHVLLIRGKSLDIVKEVRLIEGNGAIRENFEQSVAAAPMMEVLSKLAVEDAEDPRLYAMTKAAFLSMSHLPATCAPMVTAAHLLKAFAFGGLAPSLSRCCMCGGPAGSEAGQALRLSYAEGGVVCGSCSRGAEAVLADPGVVSYADSLLHARFADLSQEAWQGRFVFEVLSFCQMWSRVHLGSSLKSLDFLMTTALP